MSAWTYFVTAVREDHATLRRYGDKYQSAGNRSGSIGIDLFCKIGFQMMVTCRLMHFFSAVRLPLAAQITSRIIRHFYGADIHWKAEFEPGVMIVHGMSICISHGVRVGSGTILFQGVTLGETMHPETRQVGAPRLEDDVHVGPGATVLGPIIIGRGSKIMAGCVVTRSIPAQSVVEAPAPHLRPRVSDAVAP